MGAVKRSSSLVFIGFVWDSDAYPTPFQRLAKLATAIALVRDNALRASLGLSPSSPFDAACIEQLHRDRGLMLLTRRE